METMSLFKFLLGLGRVSAQAGVLVLVVLLAQWVFRRQLTPRWRCALWLLVAVRLLLPFSLGSATSVFNLLPHWPGPAPSAPGAVSATRWEAPSPAMSPPMAASAPPVDFKMGAGRSGTEPSSPAAVATGRSARFWPAVLLGVWLAGVLALAGHVVVSFLRLAK